MDSTILSSQHATQIQTWLGRRVKFTTLYRMSRDGAQFHAKCDGKAKTITVVKSTLGNIFGGYTSVAWASVGGWVADPTAFLFILCSANGVLAPEKLPVIPAEAEYVIYDYANYGPCFGSGYDLCLMENGTTRNYSNIDGTYYTKPQAGQYAMGNGQHEFNISDYEVFDVSQTEPEPEPQPVPHLSQASTESSSKSGTLLAKAWRSIDWNESSRDRLKTMVIDYQPCYREELNLTYANALVIGSTGAGKTTFLSTLASVMLNRISSVGARGTGTNSLTLALTKHPLMKVKGVRLWDTMGWSPATYQAGEMGYIVDGNIPAGFPLQTAMTPESPGFVSHPNLSQKVHVILVLVAADMVTDATNLARLRNFRDLARLRGIPFVIGLTKVDVIDKKNLDNDQFDGSSVANVFLSEDVRQVVNQLAKDSGVDANDILPLKGYCKESEQDTNIFVDILALKSLEKLLNCADDYFISKHNADIVKQEETSNNSN